MLTAVHLTRRFGTRLAVEDVSFDVRRGEIFALLGPNGAGKTTTLRMLSGLIAPTSGEVRVDGQPVRADGSSPARSQIGFLTEAPGLWERLSVRRNLLTYGRLYGLPDPARAVDEVLRLFDLGHRADDICAVLSKGLKQRAALARTLLHDPAVVLLDEPTSGLDPESARDVRQLVLRLRDEGRAVMLSTHNLDEVERVADRVAVLKTKLLAVDAPAALRDSLFGRRVRIRLRAAPERFVQAVRTLGARDVTTDGSGLSVALAAGPQEAGATGVDTPAIVRRLVELGADIEAVIPEEPALEDVYLRLVREEGQA